MRLTRHLHTRPSMVVWLFGLMMAFRVDAALLYLQDFAVNDGWTGSGADTFSDAGGQITLGFDAEGEEPGPGFGTFVSPLFDFSSSEPYLVTSLSFELFAGSVAPSFLFIQLGSGASSVFKALTWVSGLNSVALFSSSGWGGDTGSFSAIMADLEYVDVSVGRSGTNAQTFSMDNFQININEEAPPPAVPEPSTAALLLSVVILLIVIRRKWLRQEAWS